MIILSILLGGLARSLVGSGHLPRWAIYPPVAVFAAVVGLGYVPQTIPALLFVLWLSLVASLNLALGYTQWENWKWMALRFGLPSLVLLTPLAILYGVNLNLVGYMVLSLLAGLFYPHRQRVFEFLRLDYLRSSWFDSSRLAEMISGACILGGLSLL